MPSSSRRTRAHASAAGKPLRSSSAPPKPPVPTPSAHAQGVKLAEELLRRHLQDHGDWPRGLVVDLWGSATMRSAGEEFAMALHLAGMAPRWDAASGRVGGVDILTLAATGSEMNSGAVVTNEATKEKFAINSVHTFPKVSIVNPALMQTVSRDYLVYSAADIIAHSIEGYFTAKVQPKIQSRLVESVIGTVIETTEALLADPNDYDARAEFAWAATLALNGITYAGTSGYGYPNHMIEHSLSALFNVPHGAGLSVVMPAWMRWFQGQTPAQFERFAQQLFGLKTAEEGIAALETWFDKIGTPTRLSQLGITEADLPAILENLKGNARWFGLAETYTQDVLATILRNAM